MEERYAVEQPVDRFGRIRPVRDRSHVNVPVIGHVVRMEDGFYAFYRDECVRHDTVSDAVSWIGKKWS